MNLLVRAVGIDSGTMSMDILGFDDEKQEVFLDKAIPREVITERPDEPIRLIKNLKNIDAIVVSSGYGIPLKKVQDTEIKEIEWATFINKDDEKRKLKIIGLRKLMKLFKESNLPAYFTPGVLQLETVPAYRKINRIDMGTSDKVFSVVQALKDEKDLYGKKPSESSFILIEIGYAYTASISLVNGKIVDGIGGTSGFPGFLGGGFIDAELCYAMASAEPAFSKYRLFQGGVSEIINESSIDFFNSLVENKEPRGLNGIKMMSEAILKDLAVMLVSNPRPQRIYLSGRFTRYPTIYRYIENSIKNFMSSISLRIPISKVSTIGKTTKEAASGAAVLANGLAGGRYKDIVDTLEIRKSKNNIFSFIKPHEIRYKIRCEF